MAAAANWPCQICTYENQPSSRLCEMCGTKKPGAKGDADNGWKCILCTFVNPPTTTACSVCGAPSPLTSDLTGKQICTQCTTINSANSNNCSVCEAPLNHKIIQKDDNGDLQLIDHSNKPDTSINDNTDLDAISQFVDDAVCDDNSQVNNQQINNNNNSLPQYANPLGYNGYPPQPPQPQHYQPPAPQMQYQPQPPQQMQFQFQPSHNAMPPMPPQQSNDSSGGWSFGGFGGWGFGGGSNSNHSSSSKSHKKRKSKRRSSKYNKHNHNHDQMNTDDQGVKFKDVSELFQKDANDTERMKKEEEEVKVLSEWYSHIYLTKPKNYDKHRIQDIIGKMIKFIPKEHFEEVEQNKKKNKDDEKTDLTSCQVCYCEFDNDEGKLIVMQEYCNHAMICKSCFVQHLKIKIKDDDITPWIPCAAPDCKAPICCQLLFEYLDTKDLYKFAEGFIRKHLARNNNWIRCQTKNCNFGWMILDKDTGKQHKLKCDSCKKKHTVSKDPLKADKGFNDLIKSGVLRTCPKCSLPTMKDKGMCNVMHCGKCGIYWNWRTRETGTSSSQLKNRARNNGTLWEPGELAYQQRLQRDNLPEFIKLLERNGIKYDPNYVRGTR